MTRTAIVALAILTIPAVHHAADELPAEQQREKGPRRVAVEELEAQADAAIERMPLGPIQVTTAPPGLDWIELGPRPIQGEYWSGGANGAGRVSGIAVDPRDGDVVYMAAAGGGVWKTTDGGANWVPLGDQLSSLASGALAIDPILPDVVYYATGEQHYSSDSSYGDGVFRSNDGGATWSKIATRTTAGSYVARIAVHPRNSAILYLASSRGFVRSGDGGATWVLTLSVSGQWCNDLVIDAQDPDVVYASVYSRGIYKSIDAGLTWTQLTGGLPASGFQRINLAIAPSEGKRLFASFVNPSGGLFGFYRTLDGGVTWTQMTTTPNYLGGQGWYDNTLVVHPSDPSLVFAGGVFPYNSGNYGVIRSTNSALNWTDVSYGLDGGQVHPDQQILSFGPDGTLWLGNDGGVWKTTNSGNTWTNCNATLGITQFYTVAHHPSDPNWLVGGTQDNGTVHFDGGDAWPQVVGGDGGPSAFRTGMPDIFYTTYVFLDPTYSWNTSGSFLGNITGPWGPSNERADWCQGPLVSHPTQAATLFAGTYRIWRTTNGGSSWATISGDLTGGSGNLRSIAIAPGATGPMYSASSNGRVHYSTDAAIWTLRSAGLPASPLPDVVLEPTKPENAWVIADRTSGPRVFATSTAGLSWTSVTGDFPTGLRPLALAVDFRVVPPRLYVGTDYGAYTSTNGGNNWIKSSNDLPNVSIYDLALDPVGNALIAATHGRGMFRAHPDVVGPAVTVVSPNGGEQWSRGTLRSIEWIAADGAGVSSVNILLSTNGGATYDATLASGLPNTGSFAWTTPDSAFTNCRIRVVAVDAWANSANDASNADFAITTSTGVASSLPHFELLPTVPNPARGAIAIRYSVARTSDVDVQVYDPAGRLVRTWRSADVGPGSHSMSWDGRDARGRKLPSGVYFLRLRAGDFVADRRVTLAR